MRRRPVAQIVPLAERPTWLPAARFFSRVRAHPADAGLRDDLAELEMGVLAAAEPAVRAARLQTLRDADLLTQDADFDAVPRLRIITL